MELRWLGETGVRVSSLALGTMGFGGAALGGWVGTIDQRDADRQVAMALDAGVTLFDTADVYGRGASERLLGTALARTGRLDDVLVSTKVHSRSGDGPNDVGLSRWHVLRACEASLRRLGREHIDVYHLHGYDACTPFDETLGALDDLVRSGKVRYVACSNRAAWQMVKALAVAERRGLARFCAAQVHYPLVSRDVEHEIVPACRDQGLGVLVWSPLAGGFLSGKFTRDGAGPEGARRTRIGDLGVGHVDPDRGFAVLDVARTIADRRGVSVAQVALNWVRARDGVTSVIVGARTTDQLADNLAAATWSLEPDELARLDAASAPALPYPVWYQRQFTAERFSRDGAPAGAFDYRFATTTEEDDR